MAQKPASQLPSSPKIAWHYLKPMHAGSSQRRACTRRMADVGECARRAAQKSASQAPSSSSARRWSACCDTVCASPSSPSAPPSNQFHPLSGLEAAPVDAASGAAAPGASSASNASAFRFTACSKKVKVYKHEPRRQHCLVIKSGPSATQGRYQFLMTTTTESTVQVVRRAPGTGW